MPEKELPLGKGRRPELAADSESNGHEWGGEWGMGNEEGGENHRWTLINTDGNGRWRGLPAGGLGERFFPADLRRFSQISRGEGRTTDGH